MLTEASAESSNSQYLEGKRRHEEKLALTSAMDNSKVKIVLSGQNGQEMLNFYGDTFKTIQER